MTLDYANLYTTFDLMLRVEHNGETLDLAINKTLDRSVKNRGASFSVLNDWLSIQPVNYQTELFNSMKHIVKVLNEGLAYSYESEPIREMWEFLDMFDLTKIKRDLVSIGYTFSPELPAVFDENADTTSTYSNINTYVQSDYMDLLAFMIPAKLIGGLLSHLVSLRHSEFGNIGPYHAMFAVREHKIYDCDAYTKLSGMVLARDLAMSDVDKNTRTMKTLLGKEEAREWVLGTTMLTIAISAHFPKLPTKSLSVLLFNNSKSKLEANSQGINQKTPGTFAAAEEKESALESYRYTSDITIGADEGVRFAYSNLEYACRALSFDYDKNLELEAKAIRKQYTVELPVPAIGIIIGNITYHVHPDINRLGLDGFINAVALAARWCRVNNLNTLADLITCDSVKDPTYVGKSRIKLDEDLFQVMRDKASASNVAEEQLKNIAKNLIHKAYIKNGEVVDVLTAIEELTIAIQTA